MKLWFNKVNDYKNDIITVDKFVKLRDKQKVVFNNKIKKNIEDCQETVYKIINDEIKSAAFWDAKAKEITKAKLLRDISEHYSKNYENEILNPVIDRIKTSGYRYEWENDKLTIYFEGVNK